MHNWPQKVSSSAQLCSDDLDKAQLRITKTYRESALGDVRNWKWKTIKHKVYVKLFHQICTGITVRQDEDLFRFW